jgi:hypothetical protein
MTEIERYAESEIVRTTEKRNRTREISKSATDIRKATNIEPMNPTSEVPYLLIFTKKCKCLFVSFQINIHLIKFLDKS